MRGRRRRSRHPSPVSCCLSATGVRFLGHPAPGQELGLPHGRLTGQHHADPGPGRGCRVPHERDTTGLGAPSTPGRRCSPGCPHLCTRRLPLPSGQSCIPTVTSHRRGSKSRGIIRGSLVFTPPVFPSPVVPGWNGNPWASTLGFAPRSYPRRTPERGQAASTGPELHHRHQSTSSSEFTQLVRPRVARCVPRPGCGGGGSGPAARGSVAVGRSWAGPGRARPSAQSTPSRPRRSCGRARCAALLH